LVLAGREYAVGGISMSKPAIFFAAPSVVFAIGCHSSTPPEPDSGPAHIAVSPTAFISHRAEWEHRKELFAQAKKPVHPKPPPTDPHTASCLKNVTSDWTSLKACLDNRQSETTSPHKLMAAGAQPQNPCSALLVPAWDFSPLGNDSNTCTDAAHSCATYEQVFSRYGCGGGPNYEPKFPTSVFWRTHGDMPSSTSLILHPHLLTPGTIFEFVCDTTTVGSGTTSGVVPKNVIAKQALNIDFGVSAASFVGNMFSDSTQGQNPIGWVDSQVPGSDGGLTTVDLMTQPDNLITTGPNRFDVNELNSVTNGDTYAILRPSQIWLQDFTGGTAALGPAAFPSFEISDVFMLNCWVQTSGIVGGVSQSKTVLNNVSVIQSRFDSVLQMKGARLFNTLITSAPSVSQDSVQMTSGSITSAFGADGVDGPSFGGTIPDYGNWFLQDTMWHGRFSLIGDSITSMETIYLDGVDHIQPGFYTVNGSVSAGLSCNPCPQWYGNGTVFTWSRGYYSWLDSTNPIPPSNQRAFNGVTVLGWDGGFSYAVDPLHKPLYAEWRPLNATALYTTFANGGFDGLAFSADMTTGWENFAHTLNAVPQTPVIWPTNYGGTGFDSGCPDGAPVIGGGTSPIPLRCGPTPTTGGTVFCNTTAGGLQWVAPGSCI